MSWTPNESTSDVARGKVPGATVFGAYGKHVATGAESGILWPGGVYTLPPAAGVQMSIVSSSPNDTAAGTGIRTLEIHCLLDDLTEYDETIVLNGTTPVLTVATNIRFIQCQHMVTYGTLKAAAGTITASFGGQVFSEIAAGAVRCSSSMRMVPAGKRLLVDNIFAGSASGAAAAVTTVEIVTCHFGGHDYSADSIFFPLGAASFQDNSGGISLVTPTPFLEGSVFGLFFATDKPATITGFWQGRLENAA